MEKCNKANSLLKNNTFRAIMYITMLTVTAVVNLDYVQSRESSKGDFIYSL
jgi:hypothetical protein